MFDILDQWNDENKTGDQKNEAGQSGYQILILDAGCQKEQCTKDEEHPAE